LLDAEVFRGALALPEPGEIPYLGVDRLDLPFLGALPPEPSAVVGEHGQADESGARGSFLLILNASPGRDAVDWEGQQGFEPGEMAVDRGRFPPGIGEDGGVDGGQFSMLDEQGDGGGLDARAEIQDAEHGPSTG